MTAYRSILGIDLRVTSVKVVEVDHQKDQISLKNWGMTEIPYSLVDRHPQKEDAQAEALQKILQVRKIKTRDAAVVLGGNDVFVKIYTLSEVSRAETTEIIKWKFAEEVPFPIEEALIDFYPLPKTAVSGEKVDYVAACVNVRLYKEVEYVARKAGLKLVSVTIIPDCLQKVFEPEIKKSEDKTLSAIYMGKRTSNISIFRGGNLEFNRELNIGGENITLAMSGVLVSTEGRVEISPEEAEKMKVEHGVPVDLEKYPKLAEIPLTQLQAMVRPALERILDEVMRTFEYYKGLTGESAIGKILLTGGSSMTISLPQFLSDGLGIEVAAPGVMEGMAVDEAMEDKATFEKASPRLSAALGAALVGDEKINLIPEEIKHRWQQLTKKFIRPQYVVSAFLGFLALVYLVFWLQAAALQAEIASIQKKLEEYKPRLATLDAITKTAEEEERKKLASKEYESKRTKMPKVFEEISRIVPKSVFINNLNMTPTDLHLWGTALATDESAENILSKFVLAMSSSSFFQDVKLIQAVKNESYSVEGFNFEIVAKVNI